MKQGSEMSPSLTRAAAALLFAASACSTETGVLVEVTRDDTVPADINRLEFYVGTDKIEGHPANFVDFESEDGTRVDGRDLAADPYRLMLRVGDSPGSGIMVAVVAYQNRQVVGFGALDGPVPFVDGKVTMWSIVLSAELPDGFAITDNGCLHFVDAEGNYVSIGRPGDLDCDGYIDGQGDCDDLQPDINDGATDVCGNGINEDCDADTDENTDDDGDLVFTCDGDCNDGDPGVNPNADDACDGVDNDCNGVCDDAHDADGDQYTVCGSRQFDDGTCIIDVNKVDCDDGNPDTNPGALEICDGEDNDCNGVCEDSSGLDPDGDFYTACGSVIGACGKSLHMIDCEPDEDKVHPGAPELCDGKDDDCDGQYLETAPCFGHNPDNETECSLGVRTCAESDGGGSWVGECSYNAADQVPIEACNAYDGCHDDPDAIHCAIEGGLHGDCDVNFQVSSGMQCPARVVALPTGGSSTCTWKMLGGTTELGGYLAGLVPVGAPDVVPALTLAQCDAALRVDQVVEQPPAPAAIVFLVRSDGDAAATYMAIDLASVPNDGCTPPDGLVCSGP